MNTPTTTSLPLHVFKLNLASGSTAPTLEECDQSEAKVMTKTYRFAIALSSAQSGPINESAVPSSFFEGIADCEAGRVRDMNKLLDEQQLATPVPV